MFLYWAAIFLVIAIIAGILGFGGVQHSAIQISKTLFFIFVVLFILALLGGVFIVQNYPGVPVLESVPWKNVP